ncbi:MAG: hydroxymethylbilane synthase [Blastocatellia bacterium]|jgi:hydroxymethylbilane synthase|nr:hydroxymethylbilane synthase [Blastocatellia bacterium]
MKLTIGSRGSRLALWQAAWVREQLRAVHPELDLSIEIIKTTGDEMKSAPLSVIGGKGVFTKEIDDALLNRRIDLAVHSLKDLPTVIPGGLALAAITEREDARDALLLQRDKSGFYSSLKALPRNSVIGTSSPRRAAQLRNLLPKVVIKELRGNIDTRVAKLDRGEYDAIVLASAGLLRLELKQRISIALSRSDMLPAIGQGALAIEVRSDDTIVAQLVAFLDHLPTRQACSAERSFLRMLGGGCELPIAGYAVVQDELLELEGLVAEPSGERIIRDEVKGKAVDAVSLGQSLGMSLLARGANQLLTA